MEESVPDVVRFSLASDGMTFRYIKYVTRGAAAAAQELHLRDLRGRDHNLGPVGGRVVGNGANDVWFVAADGLALTHVRNIDAPLERGAPACLSS